MRHHRWVCRRLFLLALGLVLCACSGGGSGSGGSKAEPATAEAEPNDVAADALDLGVSASLRVAGTIGSTATADHLATGDPDHFRFVPSVGGRLTMSLTMPAGSDFDLALLDDAGRRLATARRNNLSPGLSGRERLYAYVFAGRPYVLRVAGFAGSPGEYLLEGVVTADPAAGPVGTPSTTTNPVGAMGTARCFHANAVLPDGRVLVAGGTTTAQSSTAAVLNALGTSEFYVPATQSFTPGPGIGGGRFGPTATALPDGRVLLAGGDLAGTAALYDPHPDAMESVDIPLSGGSRLLHTATLLPDGRVLLAGGVRIELTLPPTSESLATTVLFDPKDNAMTPGPALLATRISHAACLLTSGNVLISGGEGRDDTEVVDLTAAVFASRVGPGLSEVRDDHSATTLLDGSVLIAGGQDGVGKSRDDLLVLLDPAAGASSSFHAPTGRLSVPRADHVAILTPSGQVLLLGGENDPGNGDPDIVLQSVDLFQPGNESVTPMPDLYVGRDDHRAVRLPDGKVLVTGGENAAALSIADAETYIPR